MARWSGRALDPAIAAVFADAPGELLAISSPDDLWAAVVDAEPVPRRAFRDEAALEEALAGFGDAADLKSPWFTGHSRGVAGLARAAAELASPAAPGPSTGPGLCTTSAGWPCRLASGSGPGPLRAEEWELVRLHPYHTGRILARSPVLAPLGLIACRHHERMDGSGYPAGMGGVRTGHRGLPAGRGRRVPRALRAAAAPGRRWTRPRRRASCPVFRLTATRSARCSTPPARRRPPCRALPAGLTERELEILRLLAAGRTKRQIAAELVISQSTVHTHTVHIYAKCGVSTRAGLAMFAMRHGLAARTGGRRRQDRLNSR